jgi:integrase
MARAIHRLSDRRARTAGPGMYADGGGLYLQVGPTGSRSWIFRYATGELRTTRNGKVGHVERAMGLGAFPDTSLAEARAKALDARKQRATGIDPLVAKRAVRAPQAFVTFEAAARDYIASHQTAWGAAYVRQWENSLATHAFPTTGNVPVAAVDTDAVFKVLSPIWHEKLETASRLRGQIEAILDAAKVRGLRSGDNPASWRGNLSHLLAKKSQVRRAGHHAAMPYTALPGFMATLRARDGAAARALELLIMTAARTGEVLGARWSEIDLAGKVWTIPAERMKAGRDHRVPLSDPAIAILKVLPNTCDFVFPGERRAGKTIHDDALSELLERMGVDCTVHGFRSTFRDWAAETTGYPNHVVEMALAHAVGNKVEAAYRRGDLFEKRTELMVAWAAYCGGGV